MTLACSGMGGLARHLNLLLSWDPEPVAPLHPRQRASLEPALFVSNQISTPNPSTVLLAGLFVAGRFSADGLFNAGIAGSAVLVESPTKNKSLKIAATTTQISATKGTKPL